MKRHIVGRILVIAALFALCAPLTFADSPGKHPGYLHALSDLRYARALLSGDYNEQWPAIREIDAAIREAREASIWDGKPLSDHPPVDGALDRGGRLRRAEAALDSAMRDTAQREDNPAARAWRDRCLHHIEEAHSLVGREMQAWEHRR